ncbi:MAG: SDR family oxidoreductase [Nitrospinae bacterium]|nr:SDR family oxidoreductase [Nitrospinota bacterium]
MKIKNSVVLVTGSNRGIGKSYVTALLNHGAKKVYAGIRDVGAFDKLASEWPEEHRGKVEPVALDITNEKQIQSAAAKAGDIDLLINNAGIANFTGLISAGNLDSARQEMEVNYFGTLMMSRAFAPVLKKNGGGALVNVLTVASLGNFPVLGSYSASKAALHSLTQGIRAELAAQGTRVFGVFPGPIETDMAKDFDMEKSSPDMIAEGTLKAMVQGVEDIFIDPMAVQFRKDYFSDPKALEKQLSEFLPVASS